MKKMTSTLFLVMLFICECSALANDSAQKESTKWPQKLPKQWSEKMQALYKSLVEITTDTVSEQRFNAPQNKARIEKNTKQLMDRAHDLTQLKSGVDQDPTLGILSGLLQDETRRAYSALHSGHRAYARSVLSQVSSLCMGCHARTQSSLQSATPLLVEPSGKDLGSLELGKFYAATHQYDRAMEVFKKITADPIGPMVRTFEWEQAVRSGLVIAVRVKNSPDEAEYLVDRIIQTKNVPYFMKQDALQWKNSIKEWRSEMGRKAQSEEGLKTEVMRLIAHAREVQKYPADRSADIIYLRASALDHELLKTARDPKFIQDALLMAGMCYDVLRPVNIEDLHDIYYEACIRKLPHTSTSEACYRRYEQSLYEGYTGTAGMEIPPEMQKKLKELEELAHPAEGDMSSPS